MTPVTIALLVIGVILIVFAWAILQLILQNGRILVRLDELERRFDRAEAARDDHETKPTAGLIPGTLGMEFELPSLDGTMRRLSDMTGAPLALIFFDPESVECQAILPDLATLLSGRSREMPMPVLISTGAPERTHEVLDAYDIDALTLMQEHAELAGLYLVTGTPSAYLLDERLRTATPLIQGADGVLRLLEIAREEIARAASIGLPSDPERVTPYSAPPRPRQPLRRGERAPDFRLPLLDGDEVTLGQFSGRRLLLIFGDPTCEPCLELMPALQAIAASREDDRDVLLISRRSAEINAQMTDERRLRIPVALQDNWSVSDLYGARATPAGCEIDIDGVLLTDVLIGKSNLDPIVATQRAT